MVSKKGSPEAVNLIARFFSRLRFPWMFGLFATLFGLDLLLPDIVPFIDELLLAIATLLLAAWKQRKDAPEAKGELSR